jgi:hypothetical protein
LPGRENRSPACFPYPKMAGQIGHCSSVFFGRPSY